MKTITLDNIKYVAEKDYNELLKKKEGKVIIDGKGSPFVIDGKYFIRTVTYFLTGQVDEIKGDFLILKDAAWIADTGRFMGAIKTGIFSEVEPIETSVFVNIKSIVDAYKVDWNLPKEQK